MRELRPRFCGLAGLLVFGLMVFGVQNRAQASPPDREGEICEVGTVASYIGTTCALPPAVYHWISYSCTSTPSKICDRLGRNGSEIHMRRDPNGPNTLLLGGTDKWNVKAGESVNIMIRGTVYGATGNLTWPHFHEQRAATGDGFEENITTVECGENCISGQGMSAFRCDAGSPEENCVEQHRIAPYQRGRAEFREASPDNPYPFSIEIKLNGGTNGSASLRSLGLHISAFGGGQGRYGRGRRRPF
ncbi:MAG: hypothetical protein LAO03_10480 [Acidobacteriia bacterium]|nr:hypothetical protein [Terriglobia bacterium]